MSSTGLMCRLISKITGALSKAPAFIYRGEFTIKDLKNNLLSRVTFKETKGQSKIGSFFKKKEPEVTNLFTVEISKNVYGKETPLISGSGNWVRFVSFEDKILWKIGDAVSEFMYQEGGEGLPSASANRPELKLIEEKKFVDADKIVESVEAQEAKDEWNRKKTLKSMKNIK